MRRQIQQLLESHCVSNIHKISIILYYILLGEVYVIRWNSSSDKTLGCCALEFDGSFFSVVPRYGNGTSTQLR
jgi:hypothetical protein